jgi:aminoglycoside 3-N-acetyltransferase
MAALVTSPHPVDVPHGPDSPVGRVHDLDGQVLLLGVGHDGNTTVHLAETLSRARYLRPKHCVVLADGKPQRVEYAELDHCCERFALMDEWLAAEGLQRRGEVGHGEARLCRSRAMIEVALARLREEPLVFLHPYGVDEECDEARAIAEAAARG